MKSFGLKLCLIGLLSLGLIVNPALAGRPTQQSFVQAPRFNPQDKARIDQATRYLQTLSAATGRFQQIDYRGKLTTGTWYLQRPGKMRFEYDAPTGILLVADGKTLSVWDPRLKSMDQYPQSETPLSLFLSKQIRFDQGVIITAVTLTQDGFILKARDRRLDVEGSISLSFVTSGTGALRLKGWSVMDAQNRNTDITLISFSETAVAANLFNIKALGGSR